MAADNKNPNPSPPIPPAPPATPLITVREMSLWLDNHPQLSDSERRVWKSAVSQLERFRGDKESAGLDWFEQNLVMLGDRWDADQPDQGSQRSKQLRGTYIHRAQRALEAYRGYRKDPEHWKPTRYSNQRQPAHRSGRPPIGLADQIAEFTKAMERWPDLQRELFPIAVAKFSEMVKMHGNAEAEAFVQAARPSGRPS